MGVPTECLCESCPAAPLGQMWKLSRPSALNNNRKIKNPRRQNDSPSSFPPPITFDNVAVDGGSELFAGLLVEVLAVDDPHLFEESRLAALAGAEQQDLHQPLYVRLLPGEASVDLLGAPQLLHLAVVEQAYGQANF